MKYIGAAYYPEQETPEELEQDIRRMKELGFNAVRMGEFAWGAFETDDGRFDWAWFDHALERLGSNGIFTVLCTPTACPPVWLCEKHPGILYQDNCGWVRPFGGRRHYCYNHPTFRDYARRIAEELAGRYGNSAYVLGFQIDNELGQEATGRCCCPVCCVGFQGYLEQKYGSISEWNRRAGTAFWSQQYQRFEQIQPPRRSAESGGRQDCDVFFDNPTLRLEWERFCSDSQIEFARLQAEAIRRHSGKPVTTNSTASWTNSIDYYKLYRDMDVVGGDLYAPVRSDNFRHVTTDFSMHRCLKPGRDFWVLETTSGGGQGVWAREGVLQPYPGALRQNAIHAFAGGAELLTYFQFKTFRYGAEQLEGAVIDVDGVSRRRSREFQQAARDVRELTGLLESTRVVNEVAVCFDYDSLWAVRIKPFRRGVEHNFQMHQACGALGAAGIGADVVAINEAIRGYRMLVLPSPVILSEDARLMLRRYVSAGGVLVGAFLTGIKGPDNTAVRDSVPAGLTEVFGMRVAEGEPVFDAGDNPSVAQVRLRAGETEIVASNKVWTESLEILGAEVIGRYEDTFRKGEAVATCNRFGQGKAYYLGTWLDEEPLSLILGGIARENNIAPAPFSGGTSLEIIRRVRADGSPLWFLFNMLQGESVVEVRGRFRDLRGGRIVTERLTMSAKEYLVLEPADRVA